MGFVYRKKQNIDKLSDQQLIEYILKGETKYFNYLVSRYERIVVRIAQRFFRKNEDIKDFSQDVFLKVYNNLGSFRFDSKLSVWIYRITYNTAINKVKEVNENIIIDDISLYENSYAESTFISLPDKDLEQNELFDRLFANISKLPDNYRIALELFYFDHISLNEIAQVLDKNINTVKSDIFRAKQKLRELMSDYYFD